MTGLFDAETDSAFGSKLLHRLDPRLKLILLLLLIVTIFSAQSFAVLLCTTLLAAGLMLWQPLIVSQYLRRLPYLRWLLLFSFLLHLCLTPGRTLFGLRFLTYDGLMRGLMVDLQLLLALFFTLLFALVTAPNAVAWSTTRLLAPLQRLGIPVAETGGMLSLVLFFLPQVFQQGEPMARQVRQHRGQKLSERLQNMSRYVGDAILQLVDKAELLAREIASGEDSLTQLTTDYSWKSNDTVCLIISLLFLSFCWSF